MRMSNTDLELRREPEQTRSKTGVESILGALEELLSSNSIDKITITEIAKRAGISKAAVYRYFPGKSAIVHALIKRVYKDGADLIHATIGPDISPEEILRIGFREYLERHQREPFRVQLRAVIREDPELSRLDLEDSRKNAKIVAGFLASRGVHGSRKSIAERVLLMLELADAAIRLVAVLSPAEAKRTIDAFCGLTCLHILENRSVS